MRKWMYILMAVLPVLSCSREREPNLSVDPEGRVEISFTVTGESPLTKADLGEAPQLETMHLAIFGGSGYLKEYVQAELVGDPGTYNYTFEDDNGDSVTKEVPEYTYKCSIALSNSSRRIHFIGNGPASIPFGRDNEVLPALLGEKVTGFWQMLTLNNVSAKQDEDGDYIYDGHKRNSGDPYEPSDELITAFQHIPLIRNWAKIILKAAPVEDSHFTPYSFAVVNVPKHGTLVPYGGKKGFITNYKDLSFDQLRSAEYNYGGNLPAGAEFDHTIPSADDFQNCTNGVKTYNKHAGNDDEAHAVYLYERPVPDANMEPTYVIVYGHYYNPDDTSTLTTDEERVNGVDCYYKVDLMAGSEYYPVLRNFKYEIQIDKISARGHDTPAAAAAAAGSADVSADINASTLPDISDGTRRMAIQYWMSKTFIRAEEKKEQLYVVFYDDINGDNPAPNLSPAEDNCVTYELIPSNAGIVKDVEIGEPVSNAGRDDYGWRPISFGIASPEEASARTQTLRIKCKTNPQDEEESPLYRDVVISLLPTQTMRVSCSSPRVLLSNGEAQRVDVAIPDGLVESMFPLHFLIEAKNLTLTPDPQKENLPVISETSIIGDYPSFHFQRTLTWEEYSGLQAKLDYEDESLWRTFSSHFITNCEDSATEVYVANEFFYTASASFTNYASFRASRFTSPVPCEAGRSVTATSQLMSSNHLSSRVYLDLVGLEPAEGSGIETDTETGAYYYNPSALTMTFNFVTTTDDGEVSVTLRSSDALGYEDATIRPWRFRDMKIMDMATPSGSTHTNNQFNNVAYGNVTHLAKSPGLLVGYYTDPESYNFLTGNQKLKISVAASSGLGSVDPWNDNGNVSATAQDYYREKWFNVLAGTDPVSITLSANGYKEETVTAPRFKGDIYSYTISTANDLSSLANGQVSKSVKITNYPNSTFNVQLTSQTEDKTIEKQDSPDRIVLPAGGRYELEASISSDNSDVYFYYAQIFYHVDGTTPQKPRIVEPDPDGSLYYAYLGNNFEYYWNLPHGETSGKLVMDAPSDRDIVITRIVLRGFHGVLNDSVNAGGGDVGLGDDLNNGGNL